MMAKVGTALKQGLERLVWGGDPVTFARLEQLLTSKETEEALTSYCTALKGALRHESRERAALQAERDSLRKQNQDLLKQLDEMAKSFERLMNDDSVFELQPRSIEGATEKEVAEPLEGGGQKDEQEEEVTPTVSEGLRRSEEAPTVAGNAHLWAQAMVAK